VKLFVKRQEITSIATVGEFFVDGVHFCWTIERPLTTTDGSPVAIPPGTYAIQMLFSPHFNMIVPHLINVPGRTEIEIHPANYPTDVKGCIGVGFIKEVNAVGHSQAAFHALMSKLDGQTNVIIEVS
jgi:Family of unknown function (DUF5675)